MSDKAYIQFLQKQQDQMLKVARLKKDSQDLEQEMKDLIESHRVKNARDWVGKTIKSTKRSEWDTIIIFDDGTFTWLAIDDSRLIGRVPTVIEALSVGIISDAEAGRWAELSEVLDSESKKYESLRKFQSLVETEGPDKIQQMLNDLLDN